MLSHRQLVRMLRLDSRVLPLQSTCVQMAPTALRVVPVLCHALMESLATAAVSSLKQSAPCVHLESGVQVEPFEGTARQATSVVLGLIALILVVAPVVQQMLTMVCVHRAHTALLELQRHTFVLLVQSYLRATPHIQEDIFVTVFIVVLASCALLVL